MSFGENLQYLRKSREITQEQFAEKLEVSRQSVSKWESDVSFPETDKLVMISDMFNCTMDTLIKGTVDDLKKLEAKDLCGYDAHMTKRAKSLALSIGLYIFSLVPACVFDEFDAYEPVGIGAFLTLALAATVILITTSIEHSVFKKENPTIEPFYGNEQKKKINAAYPKKIALGIGLIGVGFIISAVGSEVAEGGHIGRTALYIANACCDSGMFLGAAFGVPMLIYAWLSHEKLNTDAFGKDERKTMSLSQKICSVIMLVAAAVFFVPGNIYPAFWQYSWLSFVIGGVLCAIVCIIFKDKDK